MTFSILESIHCAIRCSSFDFDDIPKGARESLQFIWLERVDDAVAEALEPAKQPVAAAV